MSVGTHEPVPGIDRTQYQQDLAAEVCGCGDCDGYECLPRCHPDAGCQVVYRRSAAVIVFSCRECGGHIETVAVAKRVTH